MGNQNASETRPAIERKDESHMTENKYTDDLSKAFQLQSLNDDGTPDLRIENFKGLMEMVPELAEVLFENILVACKKETVAETLSHDDYIDQATVILHMVSSTVQNSYYFIVFSRRKPTLSKTDALCLLKSCYLVRNADKQHLNIQSTVGESVTKLFQAMIKSAFGRADEISEGDFSSWCGRHSFRLLHGLHTYVCAALRGRFQGHGLPQEGAACRSVESQWLLSDHVLWALSNVIPSVFMSDDENHEDIATSQTQDIMNSYGWQALYSSASQGLSINRFQHHVFCYKAPTVMLVRFEDYLYCIGSDQEWCEKSERWGGADCFLLQIWPEFRLMQSGSGMLYVNIQDRKLPKGIHAGKDARTTFLQIDVDFSSVKHYGVELPLSTIEVWGCGPPSALEQQRTQQGWERSQAEKEKNRKLKIEDWKDNPDRQLLAIGGVQTEHAQR